MADNVANKEKDSNENNSVKEESKNSNNKKEEIQSDENENDNQIKEKNKFSNKSKTFINPIDKSDKNDKPMNKVFTSPGKKLITNSVVAKSQEQGNKGVFKELMKSINNNLNMQMALIDKDSSSESDDDDEDENIFQFRTFALEVNIKDYHIIEDRNTLKKNAGKIVQQTIKDREDISNHIIICGFHPGLLHFILPLRAKYLQEEELKWIIVLSPSLPTNLLRDFTRFDKIIYIQGSPLSPEDLFRANIINAEKAVILSGDESKVNANIETANTYIDNKYSEQYLDDETILIYKLLKKCNKNIQIMTELIYTSNIEYLLDTDNIQQYLTKKEYTLNMNIPGFMQVVRYLPRK
jgi:hypothetical protein